MVLRVSLSTIDLVFGYRTQILRRTGRLGLSPKLLRHGVISNGHQINAVEFVDGDTLDKLGTLNPRQTQMVLELFGKIYDAGFYMGDISPSQIMIGVKDGDDIEQAWLIDTEAGDFRDSNINASQGMYREIIRLSDPWKQVGLYQQILKSIVKNQAKTRILDLQPTQSFAQDQITLVSDPALLSEIMPELEQEGFVRSIAENGAAAAQWEFVAGNGASASPVMQRPTIVKVNSLSDTFKREVVLNELRSGKPVYDADPISSLTDPIGNSRFSYSPYCFTDIEDMAARCTGLDVVG